RAFQAAQDVRHHVRHAPIRTLVGCEVRQPLGEEAIDVHVECGGGGENLRVARPAETLVALRTIGRDTEEVSLLRPYDVVLQLIEKTVRRHERPSPRQIRVDHYSREVIWGQLPGIALDLHISKAHVSEMSFVDFESV